MGCRCSNSLYDKVDVEKIVVVEDEEQEYIQYENEAFKEEKKKRS